MHQPATRASKQTPIATKTVKKLGNKPATILNQT